MNLIVLRPMTMTIEGGKEALATSLSTEYFYFFVAQVVKCTIAVITIEYGYGCIPL